MIAIIQKTFVSKCVVCSNNFEQEKKKGRRRHTCNKCLRIKVKDRNFGICDICNKTFEQSKGKGRRRKRCKSCLDNRLARTIVSECSICKETFEQNKKPGAPSQFCQKCLPNSRKFYDQRYRQNQYVLASNCVCCGKKCLRANAKTCSQKCRGKLRKIHPVCCPCSFCGSVFTASQSQRSKLKKQMPVFCDVECAAEQKKWHNKSDGYRNRIAWYFEELASKNGGTKKQRNDAEKAEKQLIVQTTLAKNWKCCVWCDRAFTSVKSKKITCSSSCRTCIDQYQKTSFGTKKICCEYCANEIAVRGRSNARFCSKTCGRKALKQRREFWIRSNGPCEYVDLGDLVIRDKKKCKKCKCRVTRYNGSYRNTDASIDHIIPLSRGGWHCWSNVQLLCIKCNSLKSDAIEDGSQLLLDMTSSTNTIRDTPNGGGEN